MKKMKLAALSAVLCLVLGATAQAAGSSSNGVQVSQTPQAAVVTLPDGTQAEAEVVPVVAETAQAPVSAETAKEALGISGDNYNSYMLDVSLKTVNDEAVKLANGSISVTFRIAGVTAASKVVVLHWAEGSAEPEKLSASAGDGTVTATFTSFSPVQILVEAQSESNENNGSDSGSSDSGSSDSGSSSSGSSSSGSSSSASAAESTAKVSPKTAESLMIYGVEALAVLALAGAVILRKKARA